MNIKIKVEKSQQVFTPKSVTFTIESKEDQQALVRLCLLPEHVLQANLKDAEEGTQVKKFLMNLARSLNG